MRGRVRSGATRLPEGATRSGTFAMPETRSCGLMLELPPETGQSLFVRVTWHMQDRASACWVISTTGCQLACCKVRAPSRVMAPFMRWLLDRKRERAAGRDRRRHRIRRRYRDHIASLGCQGSAGDRRGRSHRCLITAARQAEASQAQHATTNANARSVCDLRPSRPMASSPASEAPTGRDRVGPCTGSFGAPSSLARRPCPHSARAGSTRSRRSQWCRSAGSQ